VLTPRCPPEGHPCISASTSFTLPPEPSWFSRQSTTSGAPARRPLLLATSTEPSSSCRQGSCLSCPSTPGVVQLLFPAVAARCHHQPIDLSSGLHGPNPALCSTFRQWEHSSWHGLLDKHCVGVIPLLTMLRCKVAFLQALHPASCLPLQVAEAQ
jgi:hypothetical protein